MHSLRRLTRIPSSWRQTQAFVEPPRSCPRSQLRSSSDESDLKVRPRPSDSQTERDLETDTAWLAHYYKHKDESMLMPFYEAVITNPFYAEPVHNLYWEDALVGLLACNWLKSTGLPPGYAERKYKRYPHTRSNVFLKMKYLGDFLNRNAMFANSKDSTDEDFPHFWNLDYSVQRRTHYMRGFFYHTGSQEAIGKMFLSYDDWLSLARDPNEHRVAQDASQVHADLKITLERLLSTDSLAVKHISDLLKMSSEQFPVSEEVRTVIDNILKSKRAFDSLASSDSL